jgi:hypothetical protein
MREGIQPETILVSRQPGQVHDSLSGKAGIAAGLTVDEHNGTVFAKYKPLSRSAVSRCMRSQQGAATSIALEEQVAHEGPLSPGRTRARGGAK